MSDFARGLEGVVVASTAISKVNGEKGILIYRGIDVRELAQHSSFEEVVYLLWNGTLPRRQQLADFTTGLAASREVPGEVLDLLRGMPAETEPMSMLRTATSALAAYDSDSEDPGHEANQRKARRLTASLATLVAAIGRLRKGQEPLEPDPSRTHAGNFLYMLTGHDPNPIAERTFDQALVLHADHGFNASTFSARVTTSTLSDMHSAIVSAIGTLKGPLHGGANTRVMQMLHDIDSSGKTVESWIEDALAAKKRIMGFGHRVYRAEDPRAGILRRSCEQLGQVVSNDKWFQMSREIETVMQKLRELKPNVDFYSGPTYSMLGIPLELFTALFALSRVAGWTAHVLEQTQDNRLIRPRSDYIGQTDVPYTPLDSR